MVTVESNMFPIGQTASDFTLFDVVSKSQVTLTDFKSEKATVIAFICNHCPYVKSIRTELVKLANEYIEKGISFIAINSNDAVAYPDDSPEKMKENAEAFNYPFPYLYDETQEVAKVYRAACTPDFYIFDKNLKCVYRGRFDDSRPGNEVEPTGFAIREALDNILSNQPVSAEQKPSIGCNIKWKE